MVAAAVVVVGAAVVVEVSSAWPEPIATLGRLWGFRGVGVWGLGGVGGV